MSMNTEEFKKKLFPVHQKLFRLAYRFLASKADAEDIIQEVYLKLWNMRDKLGEVQNPEAFATTITKNMCLDRLKFKRVVPLDAAEMSNSTHSPASENPASSYENSDNVRIVKDIIDKLPDQQKSIIVMRDVEEYSFDEIQEVTGLNMNNIRVNLSRARKQVRDELIKFHSYGTERNKKASGQIL